MKDKLAAYAKDYAKLCDESPAYAASTKTVCILLVSHLKKCFRNTKQETGMIANMPQKNLRSITE